MPFSSCRYNKFELDLDSTVAEPRAKRPFVPLVFHTLLKLLLTPEVQGGLPVCADCAGKTLLFIIPASRAKKDYQKPDCINQDDYNVVLNRQR